MTFNGGPRAARECNAARCVGKSPWVLMDAPASIKMSII